MEALGERLGAALDLWIVADPGIDVGVDDGIPDIMAHVACGVGDGLFPLQRILKLRNGQEQAAEEFFDMGLVHEDADVPVIAVPGQRDVVKENIRSLQPQLIDKTVMLQGVLEFSRREIMQRFIELNVWIRPMGDLIYLMPPFIISDTELEKLCSAIAAVTENKNLYV